MHHDGAGEVVEGRTKSGRQPVLEAEHLVPGDAFIEGIDEADEQEGGGQLRVEAGALGDAAGDDGGDGGGEGEQEEELGQLVAILLHQGVYAAEEMDAVGDAVADEEIGNGRDREIGQDLDQRVDLVFLADGAELKKGETCVHGEHHDAAEQDEKNIAAGMKAIHENLQNESGVESKHHSSA